MIAAMKTGVTTYATPTDLDIVITRVVNAPRRLVFEMWTKPQHLQKWMTGLEGWTMPICEIDLRPGGSWRYVWRQGNGAEMGMAGKVLEVVPPERLVTTESWGPDMVPDDGPRVQAGAWPETINTLVLTESNGHTTITLTVHYPTKDAREAALQTGMKEGMDMTYARLDELLATLVSAT